MDDPARRERSLLLRAYETTTLTRANFCALKGISDAALESALVQARDERNQDRAVPPPRTAPPQSTQRPPAPGADRHSAPRPPGKGGRHRPAPPAKPIS